jgi:hypothetical protein
MEFKSFNYGLRSRMRPIASIIEDEDEVNYPKYGDFLVRYKADGKLDVVEIFSHINHDTEHDYLDNVVCVHVWWNFNRDNGSLTPIQQSIMMGKGTDTYFANNSEIKLLIDKLKMLGKMWDFKEKRIITLEQQ